MWYPLWFAYVNDCHITENWMPQTCVFIQSMWYLTIRLRARVFYEQIVNEAQPSWLSLVENEGE